MPRTTEPRSRAAWNAAAERDEEGVPPGLVVIGTHGCAFDYGIVVTGPFAGTMWSYVDPGWLPSTTSWGEILSAHHHDDELAQNWCWDARRAESRRTLTTGWPKHRQDESS